MRAREVTVDAEADAHPAEVDAYFLFGTVTALVLAQQGRFALHSSVVRINGTSVGIAGHRGAGKTTASLSLRERGHLLCGDDVAILEPGHDSVRHVTTERPLYIGADTARAIGLNTANAISVGPRVDKLAFAHSAQPPSPLGAIVVLTLRPVRDVQITMPDALGRLRLIETHRYRRGVLDALWHGELVAWALSVAARVPVSILERPTERWTAQEVTDVIETLVADRSGGR